MSEEEKQVKLRKASEDEVFGPMPFSELRSLADTAYISPEDEVAMDGKNFVPAPEVEELEMVWKIQPKDGEGYGPTTMGTIREFFVAEELDEKDTIFHVVKEEETTVLDLLGEETVQEIKNTREKAQAADTPSDIGLEESLEVAKDLRIRKLETDLEKLQKEYDDLFKQYRKANAALSKKKKQS